MQYFGEREGRVKMQMMTVTILRTKRFLFPKILTCQRSGGMTRVQISCDICTRFARYLYSTKQCWIIKANIILASHMHGKIYFVLDPSKFSQPIKTEENFVTLKSH